MLASFKSANMQYPAEGSQVLPYAAIPPASGTMEEDLFEEMSRNAIAMIQSVWIDNSLSSASFRLTFHGIDPEYVIDVQPYTQGWFPVSAPIGTLRFSFTGTPLQRTPLAFTSQAMPYFVYGPQDGALVVPALSPLALEYAPLVVGDNVLIPGSIGKVTRVYRMQLSFETGGKMKITDGAGGASLMGTTTFFPGGSMTWQASGVPWITGSAGNDIVLNSDTASNAGGLLGFTQV